MRKAVLAILGGVFLYVFAPAHAADLPVMPVKGAPPPYVPPIYNWTGFYIGINGGYGWGTSSHAFATAGTTTGNYDVSGMLVGGTLGYNWQLGGIVFGVEADFDWSNINGSAACPNPTFTCGTENTWFATARARLGYAFDRWLPYFTGGGAFGNVDATINPSAAFPGGGSTQFGWTIGGGLEFAAFSNWTAKVEYLYADLGSFDCGTGCTGTGVDNVSFKANIVRGGLNFRF